MVLLKTVRAKLTTLVALSGVAALASLPLLHWVMTRQLVDVVDDRVPDAVRGFDLELEDDVKDIDVAARTLAESDELEAALRTGDAAAAREELRAWHETYPGVGLLAIDGSGKLLASAGVAGTDPAALGELARSGAPETRLLLPNGCVPAATPRPSFAIARAVRGKGRIVACMTFDEGYLANSSEKLGVQLGIERPSGGLAFATPSFPLAVVSEGTPGGEPVSVNGRAWALARFEPKVFRNEKDRFTVVAALDVTEISNVVRKNLALTAAVLVAAALAAVAFGARLARIMSRALTRINDALKRLEQAEYVHVNGVRTGDEIEDLASGFNTMVDGLRERDKLRTTFGKYMTPAVMDHLMKGEVELGGESLTVTILFTDIRGFTTISESMSAHELVRLLNEYFTEMVTIVMEEGGVVDKYIGDAIMAVFGAPVPSPDDAQRAVRAAVRMRAALRKLNERLAREGKTPLQTGIGLHTGEVVAGNIGSEARMEYTVIGDAVNLASRLEGATKEMGVHILISEDTKALLDDTFETRALSSIKVKGRNAPVMTFEVTAAGGVSARGPSAMPAPLDA